MPDIQHNRDAGPASIAQASAEARRQASALGSAVREALELQAGAARGDDFERVAAGLRDRHRALNELVLDCLRRQEAITEQMLECLGGLEAMTETLSLRLSAVEGAVWPATAQEPEDLSPEAQDNGAHLEFADESGSHTATQPTSNGRRGPVARLFSRGGRACAVCQADAPRGSKRELSRSGWEVTGNSYVCPGCRAIGWRLGEAGGLPFRPHTMTEA
jgi:hypothetical protein